MPDVDAPWNEKTLKEWRAEKKFWKSELRKTQEGVRTGKLVSRAEVTKAAVKAILHIKAELENIPDRVAPRLIGVDQDCAQTILQEAITDAFRLPEEMLADDPLLAQLVAASAPRAK